MVIDHFDRLTACGFRVIPLREDSKIPVCRSWQSGWDRERARQVVEKFPGCNLGLLLGDVVDVEGDSDEANRLVRDLIGDVWHPCYQSVRSVHHLFQTPDPTLRLFRHGKVEFRGHGHQSVLPPSCHSGFEYRWLTEPGRPPAMPPRLVALCRPRRTLKPGHVKVNCPVCEGAIYLHGHRYERELRACELLDLRWECRTCRRVDLRRLCRRIRLGQH